MSWISQLAGSIISRTGPNLSPDQQAALSTWQGLSEPDLAVPHENIRYVVVDVETSGLNMKRDRLISIGAVALVEDRIDPADAFQVVLRQDQVSTHENILIHGIGGSAQSEGIEPAEALIGFLRYIGKSPLVAYHAFFDQSMIDKAMRNELGVLLGRKWIDLAWVLPDFFTFRSDGRVPLDDWLQFFGIDNIVRHNAVSDAYATARLLQVAIVAARRKRADTPADFMAIEKGRRWLHENNRMP